MYGIGVEHAQSLAFIFAFAFVTTRSHLSASLFATLLYFMNYSPEKVSIFHQLPECEVRLCIHCAFCAPSSRHFQSAPQETASKYVTQTAKDLSRLVSSYDGESAANFHSFACIPKNKAF